jgi:hypothetical protein
MHRIMLLCALALAVAACNGSREKAPDDASAKSSARQLHAARYLSERRRIMPRKILFNR